MATGKVHTVVSSLYQSFKFGTAVDIVGAITADESTAIVGKIGAKSRMIPLKITVDRYNDTQSRVYNCELVDNRLYTPVMLRYCISGTILMLGSLPPEHMIEYEVNIALDRGEPIKFRNVSTSMNIMEIVTEITASVALIMNNPYMDVDIESIDFNINVKAKSIASRIWSAQLADSRVKAGDSLSLDVVLESILTEKKKFKTEIRIPKNLPADNYDMLLCGGYGYLQFLRKAAPQKFIPENLPSLVAAINNIVRVRRDKLYWVVILPPGGVTVEGAELPDLPATKALVLQDKKRSLISRPYQHWIEKSLNTDTVIMDRRIMRITVEK
jgi:hypothetical protein